MEMFKEKYLYFHKIDNKFWYQIYIYTEGSID